MTPEQRIDAKFCRICGADCTHRPRKKDPQGHYYCKECYEEAAQKTRDRREKVAAAASRRNGEGLGLLRDLAGSTVGAEVIEEVRKCGGCNAKLKRGIALCTRCGYNNATGERVASVADPLDALPGSRTGGSWLTSAWTAFFGPILLHGAVFALMRLTGNDNLAVLLTATMWAHVLGVYVYAVVDGFSEHTVTGVLSLLFLPYTLYRIVFDSEAAQLKALAASVVLSAFMLAAAIKFEAALAAGA